MNRDIIGKILDFFNGFHIKAILSAEMINNKSAKAGID